MSKTDETEANALSDQAATHEGKDGSIDEENLNDDEISLEIKPAGVIPTVFTIHEESDECEIKEIPTTENEMLPAEKTLENDNAVIDIKNQESESKGSPSVNVHPTSDESDIKADGNDDDMNDNPTRAKTEPSNEVTDINKVPLQDSSISKIKCDSKKAEYSTASQPMRFIHKLIESAMTEYTAQQGPLDPLMPPEYGSIDFKTDTSKDLLDDHKDDIDITIIKESPPPAYGKIDTPSSTAKKNLVRGIPWIPPLCSSQQNTAPFQSPPSYKTSENNETGLQTSVLESVIRLNENIHPVQTMPKQSTHIPTGKHQYSPKGMASQLPDNREICIRDALARNISTIKHLPSHPNQFHQHMNTSIPRPHNYNRPNQVIHHYGGQFPGIKSPPGPPHPQGVKPLVGPPETQGMEPHPILPHNQGMNPAPGLGSLQSSCMRPPTGPGLPQPQAFTTRRSGQGEMLKRKIPPLLYVRPEVVPAKRTSMRQASNPEPGTPQQSLPPTPPQPKEEPIDLVEILINIEQRLMYLSMFVRNVGVSFVEGKHFNTVLNSSMFIDRRSPNSLPILDQMKWTEEEAIRLSACVRGCKDLYLRKRCEQKKLQTNDRKAEDRPRVENKHDTCARSGITSPSVEEIPLDLSLTPLEKRVKRQLPSGSDLLVLGEQDAVHVILPMLQWTPDQVARFVSSVPMCAPFAQEFLNHSIDGAALMHLTEEHLIRILGSKIGPAIKLKLAIHEINGILKS